MRWLHWHISIIARCHILHRTFGSWAVMDYIVCISSVRFHWKALPFGKTLEFESSGGSLHQEVKQLKEHMYWYWSNLRERYLMIFVYNTHRYIDGQGSEWCLFKFGLLSALELQGSGVFRGFHPHCVYHRAVRTLSLLVAPLHAILDPRNKKRCKQPRRFRYCHMINSHNTYYYN